MAKAPTQNPPLSFKALSLHLKQGVTNGFYLHPKLQKCLTIDDIVRETAALSTRQEDTDELARNVNQVMGHIIRFLSAGYSVSTPLGNFRVTAQGVLLESELTSAPPRDRIKLNVSYNMSPALRRALDETEINVEIQKTVTGPQLYAVVSAQDTINPPAGAHAPRTPLLPGQPCIIRGKNIKVGGEGEEIGVTITREDGEERTSYFFSLSQLYPNTATRVGFVLPPLIPEGSIWSVKLCTQLGSGNSLLKVPRTGIMDSFFIVGEERREHNLGWESESPSDGDPI